MNPLSLALEGLARRLSAHGVAYVVIGGFATLHWGRPRLAEDLDVTVHLDEAGLPSLLAALAPEFRAMVADPVDFARETAVVPLQSADGVRVDLVLARLPLEEEGIRRGVDVPVGEAVIRFATAEDLILHKVVSERPRGREDIEGIVRRQKGRLDREYLKPRIALVAPALQRPGLVAEIETLLNDAR